MTTEVDFKTLDRLAQDRGAPFRVLIIDDEKWIRETFREFCELSQWLKVDLAVNGDDAIEKIRRDKFDLVTVDLIMPEVSGIDVLNEIRKAQPQIPIMVVTGNATEKLIREAGLLGACRVLYKPVKLNEFVGQMTSALSRKV